MNKLFTLASMLSIGLALACCAVDGTEDFDVYRCAGDSAPTQACCDATVALADACVRCGLGTPGECGEAMRRAVDRESFGRGCGGADSIRDEGSFNRECLPAMEAIDCDSLAAGTFPESCRDQIQYVL